MESACFDDYVAALIRAGYDAVSDNPPRLQTLGAGFRIADKHGLAGVVWQGRGQFASLRWQPPESMLVFDHATLTVYREDCIRLLCDQTEATGTFEELQRALTAHGFHLVPVMR